MTFAVPSRVWGKAWQSTTLHAYRDIEGDGSEMHEWGRWRVEGEVEGEEEGEEEGEVEGEVEGGG